MGTERTTSQEEQQTQVEQTREERELNKLALERARATQGGLIGAQTGGLNLVNQLLAGGELPGFLQGLPGGISPEAIGQQASQLALQNLTGFQGLGIADSGVAFRETAKDIADRILFPAEQFNIGNIQNLLNLALSGQANVQQPILGSEIGLGQRLAGLRGTATTGQTAVTQPNPFLTSFQTSLGQTLGSPGFQSGPFTFGG